MGKGSGGSRTVDKTHKKHGEPSRDVKNYIQAVTAKGGVDYSLFSRFDNDSNREKMNDYIEQAAKVKGDNLYRGSYMLAGDITNNLVFGNWIEGETIIDAKQISGNPNGLLHFSKDKDRVLGYQGYKPAPKSGYDQFENEPKRVKFEIQTTGKHFVDIQKYSHYPQEQESVAMANKAKFVYVGKQYVNAGAYWIIKLKEV